MKNLYLIFLFFFLMDSSLVAQIEVEYVFSELPLLKMNKTAFLQEKLITVGSSHTCLQGTLFSLEDDQQDLVRANSWSPVISRSPWSKYIQGVSTLIIRSS